MNCTRPSSRLSPPNDHSFSLSRKEWSGKWRVEGILQILNEVKSVKIASAFPMSTPFPFILFLLIQFPKKFGSVEHTLTIDLADSHSVNERQFEEAENGIEYDNLLVVEKGEKDRSRWVGEPSSESLNELKEAIDKLNFFYSRRFEQLAKKIALIEANQHNFIRAERIKKDRLNSGKKLIGTFKVEKISNWKEAERKCRGSGGRLLTKERTEDDRKGIEEMLKGSDETYWIDEASRPSLSTENNYGTPRKRQLCVTISMRNNLIQRVDRECSEKHSFICQIGQNDFD